MIRTTLALLAATLLAACSADENNQTEPPAHTGGHAHGPHGGHVLEVGAHVAHLEVLHDKESGKLTIYVLGSDVKTPLAVAKPPQLKLTTADGPKVIDTKAQDETGSVFTVTDAALKGREPEGRIAIEVKGKMYNPDLEHDHDH